MHEQPLIEYMEGIKQQILRAYNIQQSIAQLHMPRTVVDSDSRSICQQALRQRYIDSNIVAIGKPQSIERFAQIESLLSAGGDMPGTVKELRKVAEGKYIGRKVFSSK
jgi:hypothetical protein